MQLPLSKELLTHIKEWIAEGKDTAISDVLKDLHPADIAELINGLRPEDAVYLYRILDDGRAAELMLELDEDIREKLLSSLTSREIAEDLIENYDSSDAADLILTLPEQKQEEVIALLEDEEHASDIIDLMTYAKGTAGALMHKELVKVNEKWTVAQAVREMRRQAEYLDHIYTIYVVDDQNELLGTLSMKTMIFGSASMRTTVRELFKEAKVLSVNVQASEEEVVKVMNKYDLISIPVVNDAGTLVGLITADDVMGIMQEEAAKDYQLASGLAEDVESSDSVLALTRARLPWILIGMAGGMSSAYIIGVFDITENPQMAIFMPLIAATGGNVGVQSAALVVQALASHSTLDETVAQKLTKEFSVGMLNAVICSIIILLVSQLFHFALSLSITASLALFCVIIFASITGTVIPLTLNRFGVDPALATGPFITTTNDIIGLIIYFTAGHYFLQHLDLLPTRLF